jgi:ABC-type Fe3+/spermidine/putrescine transport system ATPase subunit
MVAGFETPDAGRIAFGGQDVTHTPANERGIGFVFQNYALFPHLSVAENVAYGLRVRGAADAAIARDVREVLALVGLAGYESQFPAQMSGGEQQRVALARAIVIRPRLLLFDEPLSNLDARLRVQMRDEIRALQRRLAITTLYVTHDQEEAMAVSDRIAVMHGGRVVQIGSAEDLYHRPASTFVARFIGRANLVAGRVDGNVEGATAVTALGRRFRVSHCDAALHAGQAVSLLLRPEAITLAPPAIAVADRHAGGGSGSAAQAPLEGRVVSRTFLGEKVEYVVDCAGEALQVVRHNVGPGAAFAPEDRVGVHFTEALVALADASTGGAA